MRKILFLLILFFAFTGSSGAPTIKVQGHRGCRGILPENTLVAFDEAIKGGADVLEMDLAVTADGILVVSHDPFINPQICVNADDTPISTPQLINKLSLASVQSFDCGRLQHPSFKRQISIPGTRIPTLHEVFDLVRNSPHPRARTIGFNIETKIFPKHPEYTVAPEEFVTLVLDAFLKSGFMERITLQSFDFRTLKIANARMPSLKTVALVEDETIDMLGLKEEMNLFAVSPNFTLLSQELVSALHAQGLKVIPWTINESQDWQRAIAMGVDEIITDYPQKLREFIWSMQSAQ